MEDYKKRCAADGDKEIVFSRAVKAGKRIYYLDVKKNRKSELYLSVTESKKIVTGEGFDAQVNYEKHKIFLYREDFDKFLDGIKQAIDYIQQNSEPLEYSKRSDKASAEETGKFSLDIDF
ncbi:MAG: DUF3276 family protein [Bacteroidales bacterium]|nr:DUF3276 family protein [Bacteroidales bacterium]